MDIKQKFVDGIQEKFRSTPRSSGSLIPYSRGGSNTNPSQKPQNTIKPSLIRKCLKKIDALYNMEDNTPYGQWLKECAELKAQLPTLRAAGEDAQKVLGIYYQPGRIRDTLNKLNAFAERVNTASNPEIARIKGYNNYCFLLMHDVDALRQVSISEPELVQADPKAVEALLAEECAQMEMWRGLPEIRQLCREMLERLERGDRFLKPDLWSMQRITLTLESLEALSNPPSQEMIDRLESMRNQNKTLRENIRQAREIQQRLLPVLTENWFRRLDPEIEDNPINQMDVEQIQLLYREALTGLIE